MSFPKFCIHSKYNKQAPTIDFVNGIFYFLKDIPKQ